MYLMISNFIAKKDVTNVWCWDATNLAISMGTIFMIIVVNHIQKSMSDSLLTCGWGITRYVTALVTKILPKGHMVAKCVKKTFNRVSITVCSFQLCQLFITTVSTLQCLLIQTWLVVKCFKLLFNNVLHFLGFRSRWFHFIIVKLECYLMSVRPASLSSSWPMIVMLIVSD